MIGNGATALDAWLALAEREDVVDPTLPIVDPHHHLWDRGGHRYLAAELDADLGAGHNITDTVHVECLSEYYAEGTVAIRPVGETAFIAAQHDELSRLYGRTGACAGMIAFADLALGSAVEDVLDAHVAAGGGHVRGIRYATAWDGSPEIHGAYPTMPGMLGRQDVREGLAALARKTLTFDAWLYFTQLDELTAAADACPDLVFVLDHLGAPIGIGPYRGRRDEVFATWRAGLERLAERPNVRIKLGGLGMSLSGFAFRKDPRPPSSQRLADAWRPYIETAILLFGAARSMFESNYPVDRVSGDYRTIWNAFKHIAAGASSDEKACLFGDTARNAYRLGKTTIGQRQEASRA